jgi:methionine-rich copper-binding protein CopC
MVALPLVVLASAVTFTTHSVGDSNYDQAKDIRPYDLDEDGDIDLLAVSDVKDDVSWFRNNGSQSFTEVTIDGSFTDPYSIIGANINNAGGLDVVSCSADNGDSLAWYKNDGSENFTKYVISNPLGDCTSVHSGDFDGDGDIDLVTAEYSAGDVAWWRNSGTGSFTKVNIDTSLNAVWDVFPYDIDDDGDLDIIVADFGAYDILLYLSNGLSTPTFTKSTVDANLDQAHAVFAIDLDQDGDKDILAAGRLADDVVWYANNGSESFTKYTIDGDLDGASDVTAGDLDGDGDLDVTAVGQFANDLVWYDNNGSQSFTKRTIDADFESAYKSVIYDIDRDNVNDIAVTGNNNNTDNITWFENIGDTTAPSASSFSPADNATGVSTTANLVITFDEVTRAGTGSLTIKKSSDNSTVETITVSGSQLSGNGSTQLTLDPSTTLSESTSYYINWTANAFKDAARNHVAVLTSTTTWNFTIGDFTAPTVSSFSPANNATGVESTADLVITFSETTRAGTGSLTIKKSSDNSTVETITVSGSQLSGNGSTQLTLNPSVTLDAVTSYYVTWTANAFKDTSRNHVAAVTSTSTWSFTTRSPSTGGASRNVVESRREAMSGETAEGGGSAGGTTTTSAAAPVPEIEPVYTSKGSIFDASLRSIADASLTRTAQRAADIITDRFIRGIDAFRVARDTIRETLKSAAPAADDQRRQDRADRKVAEHASDNAAVGDHGGFLVAKVGAEQVVYRDVPVASWYAPYVSAVITDEIATGYADDEGNPTGEFGAAAPVTYAEILAMAMRAQKTDLTGIRPPRNASAAGTWAAPYVAVAEQQQLPVVTPDLAVHASATRGDVVALVLAILHLPVADQVSDFTDVPANHPHAQAIATAKFYGIIQGDKDDLGVPSGTFRPDEPINRAEVAKMIATLSEILAQH